MTDKLHSFSLGEIDTTDYRRAERKGEHDSKGRKMPIRKRKLEIKVEMTTKEFDYLKSYISKQIDIIYNRRNDVRNK